MPDRFSPRAARRSAPARTVESREPAICRSLESASAAPPLNSGFSAGAKPADSAAGTAGGAGSQATALADSAFMSVLLNVKRAVPAGTAPSGRRRRRQDQVLATLPRFSSRDRLGRDEVRDRALR